MKTSAHIAAKELFQLIHAPLGRVNTLVQRTKSKERIVVLVDPAYEGKLQPIPRSFHGFEVVVEPRNAAIAY